jgi:D-alanyl-D-alanine carboxypeptidase
MMSVKRYFLSSGKLAANWHMLAVVFRRMLVASFCGLLTLLFSFGTYAEQQTSLARLQNNIEKSLKTSILQNASISIQIVSVDSGELVYERNPEMPLNPASNTKLVTSAAALVKLKPEYQFLTKVYIKERWYLVWRHLLAGRWGSIIII